MRQILRQLGMRIRFGRSSPADDVFEELFLTPEGKRDPYPRYHRLRELEPVHRSRLGVWVLSRYDDCRTMLRDPRFDRGDTFVRIAKLTFGRNWRRHSAVAINENMMLNTSGGEHARLRGLISKAFTPRSVERLGPFVQRTVDELLDPVAEAGGGEILGALAHRLPVVVMGEMLGVPPADRERLGALVLRATAVLESASAKTMAAANAAADELRDYFLTLVRGMRRQPSDDLLSALVHVDVDGDRLTDDELMTMAIHLFAAGFETTEKLIGNGLLGLLTHPDQMALLRRDPALFVTLPDELLRYDGSVQIAARVTAAEVGVGGRRLPAGEMVFALLAAGNRDPARYEQPDRLDLTRTAIHPLSLGGGVHHCIGAALARLEIDAAFRTLLSRFESIELSGPAPVFADNLLIRGLTRLELTCRPAASWRRGDRVAASA